MSVFFKFLMQRLYKIISLVGFLLSVVYIVRYWPSFSLWKRLFTIEVLFTIQILTLCLIATRVLFAIRWGILLRRSISFNWSELVIVYGWFIFLTTFIPFRIGELYRLKWVSKRGKSQIWTMGTLVVERLFDLFSLFLFFLVSIYALPQITVYISKTALLALTFLLILYVVFSLVDKGRLKWCLQRFLFEIQILKKIGTLFDNNQFISKLYEGLSCIKERKTHLLVFLISLLIWSLQGIGYKTFLEYFIGEISWVQTMMLISCIGFSSLLTVLPGNIGIFEAVMILFLQIIGKDAGASAVATFSLRFILLAFGFLYGIISIGLNRLLYEKSVCIRNSNEV